MFKKTPSRTVTNRPCRFAAPGAQSALATRSMLARPSWPDHIPKASSRYSAANFPLSTQRSVYFEFDDSTVRKSDFGLIERHGKFQISHPTVAIRVEGNSDERGSAEYNLALGQRRAEAVAHALKIYGLKDSQMEAVSYGEEKPHAQGHDETA